jgi:hypothetical protein
VEAAVLAHGILCGHQHIEQNADLVVAAVGQQFGKLKAADLQYRIQTIDQQLIRRNIISYVFS